uniref:Uncharacterized protein n=1 Tax=Medicago truncatula TaxID=3880 RepID=B7FGV6_MEDTR|nr:unknown [Medicago truncatula]AFK38219.1 unknown [Medicago truncatula]
MALSNTSEKFPYNFGAATSSSSPDGSTVGRGTDLVWNVNTTFARETSSYVRIQTRNSTSSTFQAVASSLTVRRGSGGTVKSLDSTTACCRWTRTTFKISNAWSKRTSYCSTCDCSFSHRCNNDAHHQKNTCYLHACHYISL